VGTKTTIGGILAAVDMLSIPYINALEARNYSV
jgi:hypothetical protein